MYFLMRDEETGEPLLMIREGVDNTIDVDMLVDSTESYLSLNVSLVRELADKLNDWLDEI